VAELTNRSRLGHVDPPCPLKPGAPRPISPTGLTLPRMTHRTPHSPVHSSSLSLSLSLSLLSLLSSPVCPSKNCLPLEHLHSTKTKITKKEYAWHNPNLLPRPVGRESCSPYLRMGQTGCSRRSCTQKTEKPFREFSAADVEVDHGEGPIATRCACCGIVLLYFFIRRDSRGWVS
jgi:hypothetical protein